MKPIKRYVAIRVRGTCDKRKIEESLRTAAENLGGLMLLTSMEFHCVDVMGEVVIVKILTRGSSVDIIYAVIALASCNGSWLIPISTSGSISHLKKFINQPNEFTWG